MPREDRILSQSEIDSLLKKIAPKSDEPEAKEEPTPVEPVESTVKSEETSAETMQTVSFKPEEPVKSEEPKRKDHLETDSIKMTEYKLDTEEPHPMARPVETAGQKSVPDEADDLKKQVAELTAEVNKLSAALHTVAQLEEKVKQLETLIKNTPESTGTLKARIDKIAAKLESGNGNKPDYGFLEAFRCNHCHTRGNVAIYIKCTSCGKENWMGWWPEEKKK